MCIPTSQGHGDGRSAGDSRVRSTLTRHFRLFSAGLWDVGAGTPSGVSPLRQGWSHLQDRTLKMPAMERVRLEVLETRRNSEKPKPKARIPPRKRLPSTRRSSPVSWKRKIFSDVDKWRPGSNGRREREAMSWVCLPGRSHPTQQPGELCLCCTAHSLHLLPV